MCKFWIFRLFLIRSNFFFLILILSLDIIPTIQAQIPDPNFDRQSKHLFIYAGMGLCYTSTPSFNTYIRNTIYNGLYDSVKTFSVGLEVFGGVEYEVSKKFSIGLDYSYFTKSRTYDVYYGIEDFFYFIHQPYIIFRYIIKGKNYSFKFGGGTGYHIGQLQISGIGNYVSKYNSSGIGFKGEVLFSAKMSQILRTYFSGSIGGAVLSSFTVTNSFGDSNKVNLSNFGIGIRIGLSYKIF